jgi:hypothetical protein
MKYATTYTLRAYEVDTGKLAFEWKTVADRARPVKNDIIEDNDCEDWVVVGVHYVSTASEWSIDVQRN